MKRRTLIRMTAMGAIAACGAGGLLPGRRAQAQSGSISLQWLGHTCFLLQGDGQRILTNPFRPIGCTANYQLPAPNVDLVLISSRLLDEGYIEALPGNPSLLFQPGVYEFQGKRFEGIGTDHDKVGGRRFGVNVVWRWQQAGLNLVHMGGAIAPISVEQKILIGRPDVLFIPVGGGIKAYDPVAAKAAVQELNPRIIVPTHFRTAAADPETCDIVPLEQFLQLMEDTPVQRVGNSLSLSRGDLPGNGQRIIAMSYSF